MKKNLVPAPKNPLAAQAYDPLGHPIGSAKVLNISRKTQDFDFERALAAAAQYIKTSEALKAIEQSAQFVVQIPIEHQKEFAEGAAEMMQSQSTGKTWPTLVRKLANGQNEIVCNCPIVQDTVLQGNPLQTMADSFQNMYLQKKLADISVQLSEIYDICKMIEQGQTDNRVGMLQSGMQDLGLALQSSPGQKREYELSLARDKISTAQMQIGESFKSRLSNFTGIPQSHFLRIAKEIASPKTNYLAQKDAEFEKLQNYYECFLNATQLLAASYAIVGEFSKAEIVYRNAIAFLNSLDFSKVQTLRYVHSNEVIQDTFCYKAAEYMKTDQTLCLEDAKRYDFINISVSGEELLEAIGNGGQDV